jgi:tetrahydromethanopterin S-methyltransferase subunit B
MSYDPSKSSWQATPNTDYVSATSQSSSMACEIWAFFLIAAIFVYVIMAKSSKFPV